MRILILSNHSNASAIQIQEELMRRSHEVQLMYAAKDDPVSLQHVPLGRRQAQKKHRAAVLRKFAEELEKQLESNSYDVVISIGALCAEALSELQQKTQLAFMIYISDKNDSFRRKQALPCDAYIVSSEDDKNALLRRGIGSALVHLLDISQVETAQICAIIEKEAEQWEELKRAFM